jgi:hypothetical protein
MPLLPDADIDVDVEDGFEDEVVSRIDADEAMTILDLLSEKEKLVLRARFGLDGEAQTLNEVGGMLNVTYGRVQQIEKQALNKIRALYQDPISGQIWDDSDIYPPATAVPQPPEKGKCELCGNSGKGQKMCKQSGYTVGTEKALRHCVPIPAGDPYIPFSLRS